MSNVVSTSGASGYNPLVVGGTGVGVKIFPDASGWPSGTGFSPPTGISHAAVVYTSSSTEGQQFTILAAGNLYVHGTSPTVLFGLYKGSSLTSTSNTLVAACAATSLTTAASYPFSLSIKGQGDANSGLIQFGSANLLLNGVAVTFTVQASGIPLTAQDLLLNSVPFCLGVQFGPSDTLNKANLQQFQLEQ